MIELRIYNEIILYVIPLSLSTFSPFHRIRFANVKKR